MSAGQISAEAVPVLIVKDETRKAPDRRALVTKFGRVAFNRANLGGQSLLVLPARPTRTVAWLKNHGPEEIILSDSSDVAVPTGHHLTAADEPIPIRGAGPVYGILGPVAAVAGVSDQALVGTVARKTVTIANPAAGADWSAVVPAGEFWSVQSLTATLVTAVTVATREARLEITDGTNRVAEMAPSNTQLASVTARYGLNTGGPAGSGPSTTAIQWGGADPLLLSPGFVILTSTLNLQAGDQWSQIAIDVFYSSAATQLGNAAVETRDEFLIPYSEYERKVEKKK